MRHALLKDFVGFPRWGRLIDYCPAKIQGVRTDMSAAGREIREDSVVPECGNRRFHWRMKGRHPGRDSRVPIHSSLAGGLVLDGPAWPSRIP